MVAQLGSSLFTLVAFLVMLGLLVLVHELGHFWTAIRLGIKVEEFGIGFPPRARVLFKRKGVTYTLNWLPIGGFVRFGGEGEQVYGVGSLSAAAPWKKIAVLVAGPLMNLLLAIVIITGLFAVRGIPEPIGAAISAVYPGSPAATAGLAAGDVLVSLAGQPVTDPAIIRTIGIENSGRAIPVVVRRAGAERTLTITPGPWKANNETIPAGFGISYQPERVVYAHKGPIETLTTGVGYTFAVLGSFLDGLRQLFGGLLGLNPPPQGGVSGIVGIARGTGEIIERSGLAGYLEWMALISLNLFLVNLLPIPALDGSHILFSLIELVRRGKKIPPEREALVHAIGFVALMGLMVLITISDVASWIGGAPALGGG